ncbi:YrhA family protein [Sporolactobacillus terrae]|uniref:YrhA family protein n=1 Tax=Sporolactobacillus terrae TaxID=269673 RepID=UPI0004909DB7|nr:YrhA family protein [Sporolactobacillus terrae]UAK16401.1 YrhA family protein [Sporolactobacillus terrae]
MLDQLLSQIENKKKSRGRSMRLSAKKENIDRLKKWVSDHVRHNLWFSEYEHFLNKMDGLNYNGLVIYNSDPGDENNNLISANEIWWDIESNTHYLFLGDGNISWYAYDIEKNKFVELDKPSGDLICEFDHFNQMFEQALKNLL